MDDGVVDAGMEDEMEDVGNGTELPGMGRRIAKRGWQMVDNGESLLRYCARFRLSVRWGERMWLLDK